jgi:hypothetical protein
MSEPIIAPMSTMRQIRHDDANPDLTAEVWFPAEGDWGNKPDDGIGGPPPANAGTIYIAVGTDSEWIYEDGAVFATTLEAIVAQMLENWRSVKTGKTDEAHHSPSIRIAAELRRLADMLDAERATPAARL